MFWRDSAADTFRKSKYRDLFTCLDRDRNSRIEDADLQQAASILAASRGWEPQSVPATRVRGAMSDLWRSWAGVMDEDNDGAIRLDEFVGYHDTLARKLQRGAALPAWAVRPLRTLFETLDLNADGGICVEEFGSWLHAIGAASDVQAAFRALDTNGDGKLDLVELDALYASWVTADQTDAPGNLLMTGRLPG